MNTSEMAGFFVCHRKQNITIISVTPTKRQDMTLHDIKRMAGRYTTRIAEAFSRAADEALHTGSRYGWTDAHDTTSTDKKV